MAEAGLQEGENYAYLRQNTFTQFIANRPIMDLCLVAERRTGSWVDNQWWEQDGLDLEGMWTAAREEEHTEAEDETDGMVTETD